MGFSRHLSAAVRNPRTIWNRLVFTARPLLAGPSRYLAMQRDYYERHATHSDFTKDVVDDGLVGHFHDHNAWQDYDDYLMKNAGGVALDFACGPGRNIVRHGHHFERVDGADISAQNIKNARVYLGRNGITNSQLFVTNGPDLGDAPSNTYDFIFSSIAMQHIAVHEIRTGIFRDMLRCLKPGGRISIQMGYGPGKPGSVDYYANHYDAKTTNSSCDTRVESPDQLRKDLEAIGFVRFEHWIRPPGPGDLHPNWIFFQASKP